MVTQKSRKFEFDNNIFLFSPKKQGNFSMVEFYNAKKIFKLGEEELNNKKIEFLNWLEKP